MQEKDQTQSFNAQAGQRIVIRAFVDAEWELFQTIRLKALHNDTGVFKMEAGAELEYTEAQWRDCIRNQDCCNVGAFIEGTNIVIGIGIAGVDPNKKNELMVGGAWVDPGYRGRNIPEKMFRVIAEWTQKHPELEYYVAAHREGNMNSKMTMEKIGLKPYYVEKDVTWLDGQVADKFFYRAPVKTANVNPVNKHTELALKSGSNFRYGSCKENANS